MSLLIVQLLKDVTVNEEASILDEERSEVSAHNISGTDKLLNGSAGEMEATSVTTIPSQHGEQGRYDNRGR